MARLSSVRQSISQFEHAFHEETIADRERRAALQRQVEARSRKRQIDRVHKSGSMRFGLLVLVLTATAVGVTIAMFETLYYVMG